MNRTSRLARAVIGLVVVGASFFTLAGPLPATAEHLPTGIVTGNPGVNVRRAPSTHSPVTASLGHGDQVRIHCELPGTEVAGSFTWYALSNGKGFVSGAFVDLGNETANECPSVESEFGRAKARTTVNVRTGPTVHDTVARTLTRGERIRVKCVATGTQISEISEWYLIDDYTGEGQAYPRAGHWVSAAVVDRQADYATSWRPCNP